MGYAIEALPLGVKNVRKNPSLVGIAFAVMAAMIPLGIVGGIVALVLALVPLVGQPLSRLVVAVPFKILLLGGMVGAAGAGFTGSVSFSDYTNSVRDNAESLFGAFALYEAIIFAIGFVVAVVALFVFGLGRMVSSPSSGELVSNPGFGVGMIALYLGVVVLMLSVAMVFQFLDVAVVLGDNTAVDAFRESWRLTREAPLSVLGYSILRVLVGFAVVLPGYIFVSAGVVGTVYVDGMMPTVIVLVGVVVTLALYPVAYAVVMSYHVAYYGVRLEAR